MYNQFTALDQKPLPMGKIVLNPMQLPKANKRKKKKIHSKNPYKIKKIKLRGQQAMAQKFVDGLLLLKLLHAQHPKQIITANISYKRIVDINPDHLEYFSNLIQLNCSQNYIMFQKLKKLPIVQYINISHNQIQTIDLSNRQSGFQKLKRLNLSFNFLEYHCINQLTLLPSLTDLDLSYNELEQLPENLQNFTKLKKLNLQGNKFRSDYKASFFWASLASLPVIEIISVSRNRIRGIHTEKLIAGNFSTLVQLDFSFNIVQNQHNLICARNFTSLKKLYITGNPFVQTNQYKGLQMQIYARTGAQVIVQKINPYYLKNQKQKKPAIRFSNIVTVKNDTFLKKKNVLFGIELPKDEELFSSDSQGQQQMEQSSSEEQTQEAMFMTEQIDQNIKKSKKTTKKQLEDVSQYSLSNPNYQNSNNQSQINEYQINNSRTNKSLKQSNYSKNSKSLEYDEFHKVAAQLLGNEKQYKKSFDIHTSYKALKKALDRANEDF